MALAVGTSLPRYPGRALLAGVLAGGQPFVLYFLTGRSGASKDRRILAQSDRLVVAPIAGSPEDELRHYTCLRHSPGLTIVGNGAHVDDMFEQRDADLDFFTALARHSYEPDEPIRTPRIIAEVSCSPGLTTVLVGGVSAGPMDSTVHHCVASWDTQDGTAIWVRTYDSDGESISSNGHPYMVEVVSDDLAQLASTVWQALDVNFRVAMLATTLPFTNDALLFSRYGSA